jgi:hypothetical protein
MLAMANRPYAMHCGPTFSEVVGKINFGRQSYLANFFLSISVSRILLEH